MSLDLHVADLTALRRAVERLDRAETASTFTIEVDACTTTPTLTSHPSWPRLSRLAVTTKGDGALLEAEFTAEVPVRAVVAAVARSVAPGAIATERNVEADDLAPEIPLGRPGTVEEVAAVVAWVASPEASYVSGASIVVDGALIQQVVEAPAVE